MNAVARIPQSTFPDILGFEPPPEDESFLRRIRAHRSRALERHARDRCRRRRCERQALPFASHDGREACHRPQPARHAARKCRDGQGRRAHRPEQTLLHELAEPVHRRGGRRDRPRAAAGARALVVGDRAHPADGLPAGRDRLRRLLRTRRGDESRRARRAGGERESNERRAQAPLPGVATASQHKSDFLATCRTSCGRR